MQMNNVHILNSFGNNGNHIIKIHKKYCKYCDSTENHFIFYFIIGGGLLATNFLALVSSL